MEAWDVIPLIMEFRAWRRYVTPPLTQDWVLFDAAGAMHDGYVHFGSLFYIIIYCYLWIYFIMVFYPILHV